METNIDEIDYSQYRDKLRFPEKLEQEYLEEFALASRPTIRFVLLVAGIVYLLFYFVDIYIVPDIINTSMLLKVSYLFLILGYIGYSYTKSFAKYHEIIGMFLAYLIGVEIIYIAILSRAPWSDAYSCGILLVVIALFSIGRIRFVYAGVTAWVLLITYFLMTFAIHYDSIALLVFNTAFLTGGVSFLTVSSHTKEIQMRNNFLKSKELIDKLRNAEKAEVLKSKFISLVSHDLRSPLDGIISFTNYIRSAKDDIPIDKDSKIIEGIADYSRNMLSIIDELLGISMLQSGTLKPNLGQVSIREIIEHEKEMLEQQLTIKNIAIENNIPDDFIVNADQALLRTVVRNLLSNAIKFSSKGCVIEVYCLSIIQNTFAIIDDGIGIDESVLPYLFKHGVKTTTKGTDGETGTGLGLPYCHDIIKAHHGSIRAESEPDRGSIFYVSLPN